MAVVILLIGFPFALFVLVCTMGNLHRRARWGGFFSHCWASIYCFVFGLRVQVEGTPPPPGSFAVCNHISHFDVLIIARLFPTSLVAKKEIRKWPVMGFMAAAIGTVFVDRGDRTKTGVTVEQLNQYLSSGATITLFPEGKTGDGQSILPFKRSLFAVPANLGLPTYPVALSYSQQNAAWDDDTLFIVHIFRQLGRPSQRLKIVFGEPIPPGLERKPLAFEAQARVEELFQRAQQI